VEPDPVINDLINKGFAFYCERQKSVLLKIRCRIFQKNGKKRECRDCPQGQEIMSEILGETQVPENTKPQKPAPAKKKKKSHVHNRIDWEAKALEHGFSNEKEMFECLHRDWTQKALADLFGCSLATVDTRRRHHGIAPHPRGGHRHGKKRKAQPSTSTQPTPKGKGPDIATLVQQDIEARAVLGEKKYGERLKPHNGRNALIDAYQEALDLAMYLRQAIEGQKPETRNQKPETRNQ